MWYWTRRSSPAQECHSPVVAGNAESADLLHLKWYRAENSDPAGSDRTTTIITNRGFVLGFPVLQ